MNLLISSFLCLHLLSAALWVGGMAFAHFCLRPAVVPLEPPVRLGLMYEVLRRFFKVVLASALIALLLVTGFGMIGMAGGFARVHWSVHAMVALGLVMMAMYGHIRFAGFPKLARFVAARDWPAAGKVLGTIRSLVVVNLALGVLVFIVAVIGRVL